MNLTNRLIVKLSAILGNTYKTDQGYELADDILEYYHVYYISGKEQKKVATFIICNNYNDSLELHVPLDDYLVEWILETMKSRSLKRDWGEFLK